MIGGVVKGNFGDLEENIREGLKFELERNLMMWWEQWLVQGGTW